MVGRLLEGYSLTTELVDPRKATCMKLEVHADGQRRRPVDGCVVTIARFCNCKVCLTRGEVCVTYIFFGLETDAMLGRYLFEVVVMASRTELAGFKAQNPRLLDIGLRRAGESFSAWHCGADRE